MKEIIFDFVPASNVKDGLHVMWKPSNKWVKQHKYEMPHATTDIVKGQSKYELPNELHTEDIFFVKYPSVQFTGKIINPTSI